MNLHDRRSPIADTRQIMFVNGASDILNKEEAYSSDRRQTDGAVAGKAKNVAATAVNR